MRNQKRFVSGCFCALLMLLLILDSKMVFRGAIDGLQLCIRTVIPALFPFLIISVYANSVWLGSRIHLFRPIGKLFGIPEGAESILLIGMLGGYPVGAQAISDAYKKDQIDKSTAKRMLGFCNNAGPAFIFGMIAPLFSSLTIPWVLWAIHIASACVVGILLPNKKNTTCSAITRKSISFTEVMEISIRTMANICGWIIVFRVILSILTHWFLWMLPNEVQILLSGALELSNGCMNLHSIDSEKTRFLLSSFMLSFGGICVGLQTISVTGSLGTGMYFPGKLLQCVISSILTFVVCIALYPDAFLYRYLSYIPLLFLISCVLLYTLHRKKVVAKRKFLLYNKSNLMG